MTDAAHLLVDLLSFLISLLSLWLSSRPPTHKLNYGWHRAGTVLVSSVASHWRRSFSLQRLAQLYLTEAAAPEKLSGSSDFPDNPSTEEERGRLVCLTPCGVCSCRDSGGPAVSFHHLGGHRSVGVPGCGPSRQQQLHHRGHDHAHHLWLCSVGQHHVRGKDRKARVRVMNALYERCVLPV